MAPGEQYGVTHGGDPAGLSERSLCLQSLFYPRSFEKVDKDEKAVSALPGGEGHVCSDGLLS